jgi:hypothetical protein
MPTAPLPRAELATVASFPANYFLENLALRADNSALITAESQGTLVCTASGSHRNSNANPSSHL